MENYLHHNNGEANLAKAEMCLDEAWRIIYRQLGEKSVQLEFKQILVEIKLMIPAGLDEDYAADSLTNYFAVFIRDGFVEHTLDLVKLAETYPSVYDKLTDLFKLAKKFYLSQGGDGESASLMEPQSWGKI